jgi:hypothetical protein
MIWARRFDLIRFSGLSYLVPVLSHVKILYLLDFLFSIGTKSSEKNGKKSKKKFFYRFIRVLKMNF